MLALLWTAGLFFMSGLVATRERTFNNETSEQAVPAAEPSYDV
jgi:hypothetical protein